MRDFIEIEQITLDDFELEEMSEISSDINLECFNTDFMNNAESIQLWKEITTTVEDEFESEAKQLEITTTVEDEFESEAKQLGETFFLDNNAPCFSGEEIINTDQGDVLIKNIIPYKHSINGQIIKKLIKKKIRSDLMKISKSALFKNIPNKSTLITPNHKILYKNNLIKAIKFIKYKNFKLVKVDKPHWVYNILLNKYSLMKVNNMIAETMDVRYQ